MAGFIGTFLAVVGTGMVCCNARCIPAVQVKGPKMSDQRGNLGIHSFLVIDDLKISLLICSFI